MKHYGDITKINGAAVEPVDVITGGSPCQDLSVAGKRAGLAGERSGLFMEQIRIVKEMRENDKRNGRSGINVRPRYMVWENVPGAFSSNGGEDFRAVLEETARIAAENAVIPGPAGGARWTPSGCIMGDGWSIAWRVHDAQFWGVPQRRRRIALVADFGGASAPEILFERKGVSGDFEPGATARQGTPRDASESVREAISSRERAGCAGGGKGILIQSEHTGALSTLNNQSVCIGVDIYNQDLTGNISASVTAAVGGSNTSGPKIMCLNDQGGQLMAVSEDQTGTLRAAEHGHQPLVFEPGIAARLGGHIYEDVAGTVRANAGDNQQAVAYSTQACGNRNDPSQSYLKERAYTVPSNPMSDKDPQCVAIGLDRAAFNQGANAKYQFAVDEDKIGAQVARGPGAVCTAVDVRNSNNIVNHNAVVRRLTPLECERLQGFPVVRKVRFTEMTKDEYIAWNINEGHIVVDTEYGKVFATRGPGGAKLDEPKELTGSVVNGYKVVSIRNGETKMQCRVHRIVWIAEHGIIPDGYVIDHINNDKADNRIANLQLLTAAENSTKARQDGLYKVHEDAGQAKISDEVHDLIQYVYGNTDLTCRQMAEIFGISKSRVHQIIHDEPWTDIGDWVDSKGKKHKDADSPRYKALGNSIALPFWEWMAKRMVAYLGDKPTMASLFDGIGGFPLVFSCAGFKPVWASEIEEFPIAVTKIRFPEVE